MKKPERKRTLRTLIISALLVAALSCCTAVFFSANAAEDTSQPPAVSQTDANDTNDTIEETAKDDDDPGGEAEKVAEDELVCRKTTVSSKDVSDCSHYRFKPNAVYNGSFRSELLKNEVVFYDAMVEQFITCGSNEYAHISIESMGYTTSDSSTVDDLVLSAFAAFTTDHPEAYWLNGYGTSVWQSGNNLVAVDIIPSERYDGAFSERETVMSGIDSAVVEITANRASSSRYDTVKAIHDYICNTMNYDNEAAETGNYPEAHCIAPLFGGGSRGHQFVCEGYANSFKLLCDRFDIPAVHVKGNAGGPHSWNYVQMENGSWYGVDATWDDQSSLIYTYFLIGANTTVFSGNTFAQDHVPQDQVMSTPTVYPLVYPELYDEAYTPGDWFGFWGESAKNNREVYGTVEFQWKFIGEMSVTNTVDVYLDDTKLGTVDLDGDGFATYSIDTSDLTIGTHTVKAVFTKSGANSITVTKNIVITGSYFDFLNWSDNDIRVDNDFDVSLQQIHCGGSLDSEVKLYIDEELTATLFCDDDGIFNHVIHSVYLENGPHKLTAILTYGQDKTRVAERTFIVANPKLDIFNPDPYDMISGVYEFQLMQSEFDIDNPSNVDIFLDDAFCATIASNNAEIFTYEIDTTQLNNGEHCIKIEINRPDFSRSEIRVFNVFNEISPTAITFDQDSVSLHIGETYKLVPSFEPFNASTNVQFNSYDPWIASVNEKGLITALNAGETEIEVTSGDVTARITVNVSYPINYPVKLNQSMVNLFVTNNTIIPTATLKATKPKTIKKVVWYSDDPEVVEVSQSGVVQGVGIGSANIYCLSEDGEFLSAPCHVNVGVFTMLSYEDRFSLPVGNSDSLEIFAWNIPGYEYNEEATGRTVWKSSNPKIISVKTDGGENCTIDGLSKGTVTVTASLGIECSTSHKVTAFVSATSLKLSEHSVSVYVNKPYTFKATQNKGSNDPLQWSIDNPNLAYLSPNGVLYGVEQGTTTVKVWSHFGEAYDEASVTIRTPAENIFWNPDPAGMTPRSAVKRAVGLNKVLDLGVELYPLSSNDTITWTTSNKSIVSIFNVANNGATARVKGLKKGTATITAKTGSGKKVNYLVTVVTQGADSVVLKKNEADLYVGSSVTLTATTTPKGNNDVIKWYSLDPSIATVDENGKVTAASPGDVEIVAESMSGAYYRDSAIIHVRNKATGLTWGTVPASVKPSKTVKYGLLVDQTMDLSAEITAPVPCNDTITWTTSNKAIVAIADHAANATTVTVQGLKKGTATITAKTGSGKAITYQIKVITQMASSITVNRQEANIYKGSSLTLSATMLPKGCDDLIYWTSNHPEIAMVDENGKITAIEQGDAIVTACSTYSNTTCFDVSIHVLTKATGLTWDIVPEGLNPVKTIKHTVAVNGTKVLGASIVPDSCNDTITWTTSNKAVVAIADHPANAATVTVQGLKKGVATITAKTGSGKAITYQVTVVPASAEQIVLSTHEVNVYKGASLALKAQVLPKGNNDVVMWKSSNPDAATVDENGKVTAINQGDAVITAYSALSGIQDTVTVHVLTKATGLTWGTLPYMINPKSAVKYGVLIGQTMDLYAVITSPEICNDTITWTTSNKAIVAIDQYLDNNTGVRISALKKGTATITAKTGSGCKISYIINAVSESAQTITPAKHEVVLYSGSSVSVNAKITPATSNDTLIWDSDNPGIASVDETGKITGNYKGSTVISVFSSTQPSVKEYIYVTVISKAQFVDIKQSELVLVEGRSADLEAIVLPENCQDTLTWTASKQGIVTITRDPDPSSCLVVVTGAKAGTTKLTLKSGSGKVRSINVTVKKAPTYDPNNVHLTLWGGEWSQAFLKQTANEWAAAYKAEHPNYKSVKVDVSCVDEGLAPWALYDPGVVGADVFSIPGDTCYNLFTSNKLLELPDTVANNAKTLIGNSLMDAVSYQGKYYGIPIRFETGSILYYNKNLYTEEEVKNLNTMLNKDLDGKFNLMIDLNSSWYAMDWFGTAGARVYTNCDRTINTLNSDASVEMMKWLSALQGEGKIADLEHDNEDGIQAFSDGYTGAIIAGPWLANAYSDVLGDDLGIAELPYVTVPNCVTNQHMICFNNPHVTVVNAETLYPDAALSLMQYLTNENSQLRKYEMTGDLPTASSLASNSAIMSDPLAKAELAQKEYAVFPNSFLGISNYYELCTRFLEDLFGQNLSAETIEYLYSNGFTEDQINNMLVPSLSEDEIAPRLNEIVDEMQNNVNDY